MLNRVNTIDKGLKSDDRYCIDREIVTRFFVEAYGLDVDYVNKHTHTDEDEEAFKEYIRRTRDRAHLI